MCVLCVSVCFVPLLVVVGVLGGGVGAGGACKSLYVCLFLSQRAGKYNAGDAEKKSSAYAHSCVCGRMWIG